MICLAARCLVVCGVLLLPMTGAAAVELEIGARFPAAERKICSEGRRRSEECNGFVRLR